MEQLGPAWRIVDYHPEDPDFLAIGPGGVFQVTVADVGRTKVQIAGDVVQIAGHRPPYVALARRDASRISKQMSDMAGFRIPVIPVVAFLGSGEISTGASRRRGAWSPRTATSVGRSGRTGTGFAARTVEKLVDSGQSGRQRDSRPVPRINAVSRQTGT